MAEGGAGTSPQVFVVDSQAAYVSMPSEKEPRWARVNQKFLLLLVGLAVLGLVVEGCFIYSLYQKTELALAFCRSHAHCQNLSSPSDQKGVKLSQVGFQESNEIPPLQQHTEPVQQRPFAHLIGAAGGLGNNSVVQWVSEGGEAVVHGMSYDKGKLSVRREGYYYIYSKILYNAAEDCVVNQHKVMKDTKAYEHSIELMKSKSFRCKQSQREKSKAASQRAVEPDDMWNSFLGGIFHLQRGDQIFITLDQERGFRSGSSYNFMGAFMIAS